MSQPSLYGIPKYYAFQAEEGEEDEDEDQAGEGEGEGEEEMGTTPAPEETPTPTPAPTPAPTPSTPQFDLQGITTSFSGIINSALGFFQNMNQAKFFIILGIFFFILGMTTRKSKIAKIPTSLIFLVGFFLILYGGMQQYSNGGFNLQGILGT